MSFTVIGKISLKKHDQSNTCFKHENSQTCQQNNCEWQADACRKPIVLSYEPEERQIPKRSNINPNGNIIENYYLAYEAYHICTSLKKAKRVV